MTFENDVFSELVKDLSQNYDRDDDYLADLRDDLTDAGDFHDLGDDPRMFPVEEI